MLPFSSTRKNENAVLGDSGKQVLEVVLKKRSGCCTASFDGLQPFVPNILVFKIRRNVKALYHALKERNALENFSPSYVSHRLSKLWSML